MAAQLFLRHAMDKAMQMHQGAALLQLCLQYVFTLYAWSQKV